MSPGDAPRLSRLLEPVGLDTFLAQHWEKAPLVIARGDAGFYGNLLSIGDVDRILTTQHLHHPHIRLAKGDDPPKADSYTFPGGRIDPLAVSKLFADGATIVFNHMHRKLPALGELVRTLEWECGTVFQTNLYLSPPKGGGFKVHYDTHDVFILQIAGPKDWELFDAPVELPMPGQHHEETGSAPGPVSRRFTLRPGDIAYIPRGLYHQARAAEEVSLHITLGLHVRSWAELLLEAVAEFSLRDVELRRAVPFGFGSGAFDTAAVEAQFRNAVARFAQSADFRAAADSFAREFLETRDVGLTGQLEQLAHIDAITIDSIVQTRPACLWRIETGEDTVTVHYANTAIQFPRHAEACLRAVLKGTELRIGAIPGDLDDAGKLVLVRRLIAEGLLVALPAGHNSGDN